jgi:uncharacterized membrane protein SpoIIM required for sporulation
MIVDLKRFVAHERLVWEELEGALNRLESGPGKLSLAEVQRVHYLYERTSSGLLKIKTFAAEPNLVRSLDSLLSRAYTELQDVPSKRGGWRVGRWLFTQFPQTFRKYFRYFLVTLILTLLGAAFGSWAVAIDPDAKGVILAFPNLLQDPAKRVAEEEAKPNPALADSKSTFSASLMTNNTRVSIFALALGITWGIGTVIVLFYNGVMLGAILFDYVHAGKSVFLMGWLLPHGVIEIPAILIAGQAGLLLAQALIGWNSSETLSGRFRTISGALVTLVFGAALLLIWAGIIEAFLSQYHQPVIPYSLKIVFGAAELLLFTFYLTFAGRAKGKETRSWE